MLPYSSHTEYLDLFTLHYMNKKICGYMARQTNVIVKKSVYFGQKVKIGQTTI